MVLHGRSVVCWRCLAGCIMLFLALSSCRVSDRHGDSLDEPRLELSLQSGETVRFRQVEKLQSYLQMHPSALRQQRPIRDILVIRGGVKWVSSSSMSPVCERLRADLQRETDDASRAKARLTECIESHGMTKSPGLDPDDPPNTVPDACDEYWRSFANAFNKWDELNKELNRTCPEMSN